MSRKRVFYIVFFTVLIAGFYILMTALIPGLSKKRLPPLNYVKAFSFKNQDGNFVSDRDMAGKVYVASFFFTTCKGICPRMNNNLRKVYEQYKNEKDFFILSHTCDPEIDTVAQMKRYADSMKVDTRHWIFLTGRKDSLYNMARGSYSIDDPANNLRNLEDDFLHTQFWALVDRSGDVRKVYDGLKESEVKELIRDIRRMLKD